MTVRTLLLTVSLLAAGPVQAETLRRCGWYHNPTPANVILEDADGQWWISRQGGPPAAGFDDAYTPAFDDRVRIDYGGRVTDRYGYSCACADGVFGSVGSEKVLSISRLKELPISQCKADPKLPVIQHSGE